MLIFISLGGISLKLHDDDVITKKMVATRRPSKHFASNFNPRVLFFDNIVLIFLLYVCGSNVHVFLRLSLRREEEKKVCTQIREGCEFSFKPPLTSVLDHFLHLALLMFLSNFKIQDAKI